MKKLILIALIFASCKREAQQQVQSTNSNFQVELLFEADGCKIYRFFDGGYYRYFTTCKGSVSWTTTETAAKGQTYSIHHNIETNENTSN